MTLERFGQVVQELKKRGDIGIAETQGQAYQWHIVWFHGCDRLSFLSSSGAQRRFGRGLLLSFFEAIAVAVDGEDFGAMHQPINEGDDAGGVGEDLVPFAKALVRISYLELDS